MSPERHRKSSARTRLFYPITTAFLALLLFGCATTTPTPEPLGAAPITDAGVPDPPLTVDGTESVYMPAAPAEIYLPEPGLVTGVGTVTTAATAQAYHARLAGDWATVFAAMEQAVAELDDNTDPVMRWWVLMTRQRLFLDDVRPEAAQALSDEVTRLELEVFGTDLVSAVVRGDLRLNQRDFAGARAWYGSVLARLDGWEPSASFFAKPEDRRMQAYLLEALSRATAGMTIAYLLENDCARALAWADVMHSRMRDLVALPQWFPFNLFMEAGPDLQQGYGWTLALLGAARVCYSGNLAASEALFNRALDFFATVGGSRGAHPRSGPCHSPPASVKRRARKPGRWRCNRAANRTPTRRRLYVAPSGELYHLPWGMLNPDGDLAVEVVVLPTGGWLARTPKRLRPAGAAVVIGDPAFGDSYPQLPGARAEAGAVAARYGVDPLIGAAATEAALRDAGYPPAVYGAFVLGGSARG